MILELIQSIGLLSAIFFIIGFVLVVIEMFVPGFGIAGISGLIILGLGIFVTADTILEVFILTIIILTILGLLISILLRAARKGKIYKGIVLSTAIGKQRKDGLSDDLNYFLGKTGITLTILRPAGTIDLEGVKLDVVSQNEYIEKGVQVKITKVEGRKIVVKKI